MKESLNIVLGCCLLFSLTFCQMERNAEEQSSDRSEAQEIVEAAIEAAGGAKYDDLELSFDFREHHYQAQRKQGEFEYKRMATDSMGRHVEDVLTNQGLVRFMDGSPTALPAKDSAAYSNSVNSVIYFVLLPYFLNDPAAQKSYLGKSVIKGVSYHKVKVVFEQEGGGEDFQDEFVYWFNEDDFGLDYLAYNYLTEGGGSRFRQAYNIRTIGGIRFADYYNLKPAKPTRAIETFDKLFLSDGLKVLSEIVTEDIKVK